MPEARLLGMGADAAPPRRVLVVDDEPVMRLLARESLRKAGFDVAEAEDGEAALAACRELQPRIVLLDVKMPGLDGFETCRRLRRAEWGRHIPILMMTGLDDLESIRLAYKAGATDFVNKPINWLILGQRVEYMLRASSDAEELRLSRARLADAQRIARLAYWELYPDGQMRCPARLAGVLGLDDDQLPQTLDELLELIDFDQRPAVTRSLRAALDGEDPGSFEYRLKLREGGERWVRQESEVRRDDSGAVVCVTAAVQDVTQRKQAAEKIRMLSYFDELTGLPNRRSFVERFEQARISARRYGRSMALLSVDLDQLNRVNDTLGHTVRESVLRATAERVLSTLRSSDVLSRPAAGALSQLDFVACLGGDEFVVLLTELARPQDAAAVARRIGDCLAQPFEGEPDPVFLTASTGIAVFPGDGEEVEDLIQRASTAKHHAKAQGGNCYRYFDSSMNAAAFERLQLEAALRRALERGEFDLWFQPLLETASGKLVAAEALVRWHHPERGLLRPHRFIPLAEEVGLILPLGEWVVRQACAAAAGWARAGLPLRVAVNLSARQFEAGNLVATVKQALDDAGLEPGRLELELTESLLMRDLDAAVGTLARLRAAGMKLAIDDFGVGYSSLNYLTRFGVDRLKIDRSFMAGLPDSENRGIVRAVISMARSLNLQVVGEGVEQPEQLAFLEREGCDLVQGYLLGRPMPADDFDALLAEHRRRTAPTAATG